MWITIILPYLLFIIGIGTFSFNFRHLTLSYHFPKLSCSGSKWKRPVKRLITYLYFLAIPNIFNLFFLCLVNQLFDQVVWWKKRHKIQQYRDRNYRKKSRYLVIFTRRLMKEWRWLSWRSIKRKTAIRN